MADSAQATITRPQGVLDAEIERIILAMQRIIATAATPERLAQVRERVRKAVGAA